MQKWSIRLLPALVVLLALTGVSQAASINGALTLTGSNWTGDAGYNLLTSSLLTPTVVIATDTTGSGDYAPIAIGTLFSGFTIDLSPLAIAGGGGVTTGNATYGTFTANFGQIVSRSATYMDLFLSGTFTPAAGGPLAGLDPTSTSWRIAFTANGQEMSGSGTLASPARTLTPEPVSMILLGSGLVAFGLIRRKRAA